MDLLQAQIAQTVEPGWHDAALDATWAPAYASARASIEVAHGILHERFAFCQDMPWDTFAKSADVLRVSGYRPTRLRPWSQGDQTSMAAVWTRDG